MRRRHKVEDRKNEIAKAKYMIESTVVERHDDHDLLKTWGSTVGCFTSAFHS